MILESVGMSLFFFPLAKADSTSRYETRTSSKILTLISKRLRAFISSICCGAKFNESQIKRR